MTFYFNRETGRRVSKSTWARSKAQGGTRYVRRVSKAEPRQSDNGVGSANQSNPSQGALTDYQAYEEKLRKKLLKQFQDHLEDYDNGTEYETGVDY